MSWTGVFQVGLYLERAEANDVMLAQLFQSDVWNRNPVHYATRRGDAGVLRRLLTFARGHHLFQHGLFQPDSLERGPFHDAAEGQDATVVELLLEHAGGELGDLLQQPDAYGLSPFQYAAENENAAVLASLLERAGGSVVGRWHVFHDLLNSAGRSGNAATTALLLSLARRHHLRLELDPPQDCPSSALEGDAGVVALLLDHVTQALALSFPLES